MQRSDVEIFRDHIGHTYWRLRFLMAVLALVFPFALLLGGFFLYGIPMHDNMSEYYFAFHPTEPAVYEFPMRVWFVGFLWAIGCCLILYKGFTLTEHRVLNIAGLSALGVAILPAAPTEYCGTLCGDAGTAIAHQLLAVVVFGCAAYVACFCSVTTLDWLDTERQRFYQRIYDLLAGIMVLSALVGLAVSFSIGGKWLYLVEAIGFCTFAVYWLVKTRELGESNLEKEVMGNQVRARTAPPPGAEQSATRRWLARALER